jgi:hypothetical protein
VVSTQNNSWKNTPKIKTAISTYKKLYLKNREKRKENKNTQKTSIMAISKNLY